MKKLCAVVILVLALLSCGGGSSSDGTADYILQPGGLTTSTDPTTIEKATLSYPGASYTGESVYAIIYKGTVNGVSYVGISVDKDGNPATNFNLKISIQASDIPSSIAFKNGVNGSIKVNGNNSVVGDDTIILNFGALNTTDNTITITGDGSDNSINVGGSPLTITSITAYYYNASQ